MLDLRQLRDIRRRVSSRVIAPVPLIVRNVLIKLFNEFDQSGRQFIGYIGPIKLPQFLADPLSRLAPISRCVVCAL
jgi:hypothetical protein